jgi:integrase
MKPAASEEPEFDDLEPPADSNLLGRVLKGWHRRLVRERIIPTREIHALLTVGDDGTVGGRRDAAIIALMLLAGLRRGELVALQRGDYDESEGCLRVRSRRAPTRLIALAGRCRDTVEGWLNASRRGSGPLFVCIQGGQPTSRGLSPATVNQLLRRRYEEAGCRRLTPRDLRSHFLARLQAGARLGERLACRYVQAEDGEACWAIASLAGV